MSLTKILQTQMPTVKVRNWAYAGRQLLVTYSSRSRAGTPGKWKSKGWQDMTEKKKKEKMGGRRQQVVKKAGERKKRIR